jgi:O-antigen/teichoic acid export membrane protein
LTASGPEAREGAGPVSTKHLAPVAVVSAATTLWLAALGLVTTPYMLHRLGVSAYAIFALITIVMSYLSNLELGFGHATLRFLARARGEGDSAAETRIVSTSLAVFCGAAAIAALIAMGGASIIVHKFADFPPALEDDATDSVRLGAALIVLTFLISFGNSSLQAVGQFRFMLRTRVISGTCMSIMAVSAAALFQDVRAVLLGQAIISLTVCVFTFAALGRAIPGRLRPRFDRDTFRAMRRYAGLVLATGVAYQAMLQGPPTVLAGVARAAELTAYAVPAIVLRQLTLLVTSASTAFMPFASAESAAADPGRLRRVFRSHMRITVLTMMPVAGFLIVFAHPILSTWIGEGFADQAADPMRLLAATGFVLALGAPASDVARGFGRAEWTFAYTASAAVIAVASAVVLAGSYEATGAALALLIAMAATTVPFVVLAARRLLDEQPIALLAALSRPIVCAGLACAGYGLGGLAGSSIGAAALTGLVVTPLYLLAVYRLVLEEFELRTLRAGLKRSRGNAAATAAATTAPAMSSISATQGPQPAGGLQAADPGNHQEPSPPTA